MANKKKDEIVIVPEPEIDTRLFLVKLEGLLEESASIANYIGENVQYGRALGFAEGKYIAYAELLDRVLNGEFDRNGELDRIMAEGK